MKTEQEQIEQIEKVLKDSVADYKHLKKKGVCYCYAETLIDHGYGDVSEYKAEIEWLKAEFKQLETNAEILARGVRDLNHENYELTEKIKQAQIDTLNKVKDMLDNAPNGWAYTTYIDELVEEVEE